ncbi:hypothetical protein MRX96_001439 [Rhipicephalus microplus]
MKVFENYLVSTAVSIVVCPATLKNFMYMALHGTIPQHLHFGRRDVATVKGPRGAAPFAGIPEKRNFGNIQAYTKLEKLVQRHHYCLCGDPAYPLRPLLLKPYGCASLTPEQYAADASALEILENIAANGDNSNLDLSDPEDTPDGAEKNEQCDEELDEEKDCHYDSDTDVDDGDDGVSNPVMPSYERWPRKQGYASVLPELPVVLSSMADERDGWCSNQYNTRYMDGQAFELLHEMTHILYLERTGRSMNSSPEEIKEVIARLRGIRTVTDMEIGMITVTANDSLNRVWWVL